MPSTANTFYFRKLTFRLTIVDAHYIMNVRAYEFYTVKNMLMRKCILKFPLVHFLKISFQGNKTTKKRYI